MRSRHARGVVDPSPVVRLAQQVQHQADPGGELLLVRGLAGTPLHHPEHGVAIERPQRVLARQGRDERRVAAPVLRRGRHLIVEVSRDLEQLCELRIERAEQVIEQRLAQENDLHLKRGRLGIQRDRAGQAERLAQRFNAHAMCLERPFERIPHEGRAEQFIGVQYQVSAARPVQRTRPDQQEIGGQGAELRGVLHPPQQVVVGRVVLEHHRCPGGRAVVHQYVHPVAAERSRPGRAAAQHLHQNLGPAGLAVHQLLGVLDDVFLNLLEVSHYFGEPGILLPRLFNGMAHHRPGRFLLEAPQPVPPLPGPGRQMPQDLLHFFFQHLAPFLDPLPLVLGQGRQRLVRQDLLSAHRRHHEAGRRADQCQAALRRLLGERGELLLGPCFEFVVNGLPPLLVILTLQRAGDGKPKVFDQALHVLPQHDGIAGRQHQEPGFSRILEVVHVAEVGGNVSAARPVS